MGPTEFVRATTDHHQQHGASAATTSSVTATAALTQHVHSGLVLLYLSLVSVVLMNMLIAKMGGANEYFDNISPAQLRCVDSYIFRWLNLNRYIQEGDQKGGVGFRLGTRSRRHCHRAGDVGRGEMSDPHQVLGPALWRVGS